MIDLSTMSIFLTAVLFRFLSPGPNMTFVLSHGVAHGLRGGLAAAFGITAADLVLTLLTAAGVMALVAAYPASFDLLRYLGALYLLWLAAQAIRSSHTAVVTHGAAHTAMATVFGRAMLNSLLNLKALLFFMVFSPQFVVASRGHIALQITRLGVTLSLAALLFNTDLGAFSGRVGAFLNRSPRAACLQSWFLGAVLVSLAARLLVLDRPISR